MDSYEINVILSTKKNHRFSNLYFFTRYIFETEEFILELSDELPVKVHIHMKDRAVSIKNVEYIFVLGMENYSQIIVPDSGRWFMNSTSLISCWRNARELSSNIGDIKIPLYILLGKDQYMGMAVGVIGLSYETEFRILEPESNRALNVHTGHIRLQMKRGNENYPIYKEDKQDTDFIEYLFYSNANLAPKQSWILTMREFSNYQRKIYELEDIYSKEAMEPIWCSWVDWDSKDINEKMLLSNIDQGVKLGIRNYIIDDGWYGAGLDSDYSTDMEIGDWRPDKTKIPDMKQFVERVHALGARAIIWCAPHAIAKKSEAYKSREKYLIADESGAPVLNEPQYYSLCFMCPEAREIMADICASFVRDWDVDGAKYDLFNWVPNFKCKNPNHRHDLDSMVAGLEKTFQRIHEKTSVYKQNYIVELKQNYGTAFHTKWGTMMRAGDSPFDPETNYLRTLHIQSYTKYSLNDYQTFTDSDTPTDIAISILKMIAAGIPAYGVNFTKLTCNEKKVIQYYNEWYIQRIPVFSEFRVPLNASNTVMKVEHEDYDYIFFVNEGDFVQLEKSSVLLNASYHEQMIVQWHTPVPYRYTIRDCYGTIIKTLEDIHKRPLALLNIPLGGIATIDII